MVSLLLTLVGRDRPGLVASVSEQVAARGGSWLESRLAHLAGQFAGIVLVQLPEAEVGPLTADLAALGADGLTIAVHAAPGATVSTQALFLLDLVCQDRPGILREVTRILAASGVNIEELTTHILSGSFSGESLFRAEARLRMPEGGGAEALRGELEQLGNDLMVDLRLTQPAV